MTTSAELQAPEREHYEETILALQNRIAGLKAALSTTEVLLLAAEDDLAAARARARRVERRFARLLRLVQGTALEFWWSEHHGGGTVYGHRSPAILPRRRGRVWSRRLFPLRRSR